MTDIAGIIKYLSEYDGEPVRIMEVCGSHTAAISKSGIPDMISDNIKLISGPGCPVCVTPIAYVDRLIELSKEPDTVIVTFGDMLRIPGSSGTLSLAKGEGARVEMVYGPMDTIPLAKAEPDVTFIFAAVGFETTTPAYALLIDRIIRDNIKNIRLLTAIKTMPPAIEAMCEKGANVDAFLAPGHVSVVSGCKVYRPIAEKYSIPFGVAGFSPEELLLAIYGIVSHRGQGVVENYYPSVVTENGNERAKELIRKYFKPADATWRGMGNIKGSGLLLREEYAWLDAGSDGLCLDDKKYPACRCDEVLTGKCAPTQCPLFGSVCDPVHPKGACMVSEEGSCHSYYLNRRK